MTAKLDYRWHLRQVMAGRDMFDVVPFTVEVKWWPQRVQAAA